MGILSGINSSIENRLNTRNEELENIKAKSGSIFSFDDISEEDLERQERLKIQREKDLRARIAKKTRLLRARAMEELKEYREDLSDTAQETESLTNPIEYKRKTNRIDSTENLTNPKGSRGEVDYQGDERWQGGVELSRQEIENDTLRKDGGQSLANIRSIRGAERIDKTFAEEYVEGLSEQGLREFFDVNTLEQQMLEPNVDELLNNASMSLYNDENVIQAMNEARHVQNVNELYSKIWWYNKEFGATEQSMEALEKIRKFFHEHGEKMELQNDGLINKAMTGFQGMALDLAQGGIEQGWKEIVNMSLLSGLTAFSAGMSTPIPGDELIAGFGGLIGGAVKGWKMGVSKHFYMLEAGSSYAEMKRQGIRDEVARPLSTVSGIVVGALELLELETMGKAGKKISQAYMQTLDNKIKQQLGQNLYKTVALEWGKGWVKESLEEGLQGGSSQTIMNIAQRLENDERIQLGDPIIDEGGWRDVGTSAWQDFTESLYATWAFPFISGGVQLINHKALNKTLNDQLPDIVQKAEKAKSELGTGDLQFLVNLKEMMMKTKEKQSLTNKNKKNIDESVDTIDNIVAEKKAEAQDIAPTMDFYFESESEIEEIFLNHDLEELENIYIDGLLQTDLDKYREAENSGVKNKILQRLAEGKGYLEIAKELQKQLPTQKHNMSEARSFVESVDKVNREIKAQAIRNTYENIEKSQKTINENQPQQTEAVEETETTEAVETVEEEPTQEAEIEETYEDVKADIFALPVEKIQIDPERFQFRSDANENGVTKRLEGADYNENLAGVILVWEDELGDRYVVNGHHRLDLAKQSNTETINAKLVTHEQYSEEAVKKLGALINIADENASAIDIAKLYKSDGITEETLEKFGISLKLKKVKQGMALANLGDALFTKVATRQLALGRGVLIGELLEDETMQFEAYKMIRDEEAKGKRITNPIIESMIKTLKSADVEETEQMTLFGTETIKKTLAYEKAVVEEYIKGKLKSEKRLLNKLDKNKNVEFLEEIGNKINMEANTENLNQAEQLLMALDKMANFKGTEINNLLNKYAKMLADGDKQAKQQAFDAIIELYKQGKIFADVDGQQEVKQEAEVKTEEATNQPSFFEYTQLKVINEPQTKTQSLYQEFESIINTAKENPYLAGVDLQMFDRVEKIKMTKERIEKSGYEGITKEGQTYDITGRQTITEDGRPKILLYRGATKDTISEEIIHVLQDRLLEIDPQLHEDIQNWETEIKRKAKQLGIEIPQGKELFAKALVFSEFGYYLESPAVTIDGQDYRLADMIAIDEDIVSRFIDILGEDLMDAMIGDTFSEIAKRARILKGTNKTFQETLMNRLNESDQQKLNRTKLKNTIMDTLNRVDNTQFLSMEGEFADVVKTDGGFHVELNNDNGAYERVSFHSSDELSDYLITNNFTFSQDSVLEEFRQVANLQVKRIVDELKERVIDYGYPADYVNQYMDLRQSVVQLGLYDLAQEYLTPQKVLEYKKMVDQNDYSQVEYLDVFENILLNQEFTIEDIPINDEADLGLALKILNNDYFETHGFVMVKDNKIENFMGVTQKAIGGVMIKSSVINNLLDYADNNDIDAIYSFHNHPSGNATPSPADTTATEMMFSALGDIFKGEIVIAKSNDMQFEFTAITQNEVTLDLVADHYKEKITPLKSSYLLLSGLKYASDNGQLDSFINKFENIIELHDVLKYSQHEFQEATKENVYLYYYLEDLLANDRQLATRILDIVRDYVVEEEIDQSVFYNKGKLLEEQVYNAFDNKLNTLSPYDLEILDQPAYTNEIWEKYDLYHTFGSEPNEVAQHVFNRGISLADDEIKIMYLAGERIRAIEKIDLNNVGDLDQVTNLIQNGLQQYRGEMTYLIFNPKEGNGNKQMVINNMVNNDIPFVGIQMTDDGHANLKSRTVGQNKLRMKGVGTEHVTPNVKSYTLKNYQNMLDRQDLNPRTFYKYYFDPDNPMSNQKFRQWFGDSKMVDEDGNPEMLYHGTLGNFGAFSMSKANVGKYGKGLYFTTDNNYAKLFASNGAGDVRRVFLKGENPLNLNDLTDEMAYFIASRITENYSIQQLKTFRPQVLGTLITNNNIDVQHSQYDSVIANHERVVFNPTQIKDADYNTGEFDEDSFNSYFQLKSLQEVGVHYGDLGTAKDTLGDRIDAGRDTGFSGTGTYFASSDKEMQVMMLMDSRPEHFIDLNKFHLLTIHNNIDANDLFYTMKYSTELAIKFPEEIDNYLYEHMANGLTLQEYVDKRGMELNDLAELKENASEERQEELNDQILALNDFQMLTRYAMSGVYSLADVLNTNEFNVLSNLKKSISDFSQDYSNINKEKFVGIANRFFDSYGFEGINYTTTNYDGYKHGSVIFSDMEGNSRVTEEETLNPFEVRPMSEWTQASSMFEVKQQLGNSNFIKNFRKYVKTELFDLAEEYSDIPSAFISNPYIELSSYTDYLKIDDSKTQDVVLSHELINRVPQDFRNRAVRQITRVLRTEGVAVFTIADSETIDERVNKVLNEDKKEYMTSFDEDGQYYQKMTAEEFENYMRDAVPYGYMVELVEGAYPGYHTIIVKKTKGASYNELVKDSRNLYPFDELDPEIGLFATRNIRYGHLKNMIELGGFPVPSIAVYPDNANADYVTEHKLKRFGDVAVVFGEDVVDPQHEGSNVLINTDAYTTRLPKLVETKVKKLKKEINDARKFIGNSLFPSDELFLKGRRRLYELYKNKQVLSDSEFTKELDTITNHLQNSHTIKYKMLKKYNKDVPPIPTFTDEEIIANQLKNYFEANQKFSYSHIGVIEWGEITKTQSQTNWKHFNAETINKALNETKELTTDETFTLAKVKEMFEELNMRIDDYASLISEFEDKNLKHSIGERYKIGNKLMKKLRKNLFDLDYSLEKINQRYDENGKPKPIKRVNEEVITHLKAFMQNFLEIHYNANDFKNNALRKQLEFDGELENAINSTNINVGQFVVDNLIIEHDNVFEFSADINYKGPKGRNRILTYGGRVTKEDHQELIDYMVESQKRMDYGRRIKQEIGMHGVGVNNMIVEYLNTVPSVENLRERYKSFSVNYKDYYEIRTQLDEDITELYNYGILLDPQNEMWNAIQDKKIFDYFIYVEETLDEEAIVNNKHRHGDYVFSEEEKKYYKYIQEHDVNSFEDIPKEDREKIDPYNMFNERDFKIKLRDSKHQLEFALHRLRQNFMRLENFAGEYSEAKPGRMIPMKNAKKIVFYEHNEYIDAKQNYGDYFENLGVELIDLSKENKTLPKLLKERGDAFQLKIPHVNFTNSEETDLRSLPETIKQAGVQLPQEYMDILNNTTYEYQVKKNVNTALSALKWLAEHGIKEAREELLNSDNKMTPEFVYLGYSVLAYHLENNEIDKANEIGDILFERATTLGQALQMMSTWNRLSPSRIARMAQRKITGSMKDSEIDAIDKTSRRLQNGIDEINQEAVDNMDLEEILKWIFSMPDNELLIEKFIEDYLNQDIETVEKRRKVRKPEEILADKVIQTTKEQKKSEATPLQIMVDALFNVAKESPLPDKQVKVPKDRLKLVVDAIKNREQYREVWAGAKQIVLEKLRNQGREHAIKELDPYFEQAINRTFPDAELKGIIKEKLDTVNMSIYDIVKEHYTVNQDFRQALSYDLVKKAGLNEIEAQILEKHIHRKMKDMTKSAKEKLLERIFAESPQKSQRRTVYEKIMELSNLGAFKNTKYKSLVAENLGLPALSQETLNWIHDQAQYMQTLDEDSREFKIAAGEMGAVISRNQEHHWAEYVDFVQTVAQLLNPKTIGRNLIGNGGFGLLETLVTDNLKIPLDYTIGKLFFGGQRTAKFMPFAKLNASRKGLKKGWIEGKYDAVHQINTDERNTKFDFRSDRLFYGDSIMAKVETLLNLGLRATDRAFYQGAVEETLAEMKALHGEENITQEMVETAHVVGLYRTFQDETWLAETLMGAKKRMNFIGNGDFGLGSIFLKYPYTPANLLMRAVDYSPLGIGISMTKLFADTTNNKYLQQKMAVDGITRGMVGTTFIVAGAMLYKWGIIAPRRDDDEPWKVYEAQMESGLGEYQVNVSLLRRYIFRDGKYETLVGDQMVSYDWFQPNAIPLAIGAEIGAKSDATDILTTMSTSFSAGVEALTSQPLLQNLNEAVTKDSPGDFVTSLVQQVPNSFIPTLLNQMQIAIDPVRYETNIRNNFGRASMAKAIRKVPMAPQYTLEPSIEQLGDISKYYEPDNRNWLSRTFESFVAPYIRKTYNPTQNQKLILDLYESTGEVKHIPDGLRWEHELLEGNEKAVINFTPQEYRRYSEWVGIRINELMDERMSSLRNYEPKVQVEIINDIVAQAEDELDYVISQDLERGMIENVTYEERE